MSTVDLRPHLKWALQRISTSLGEGEHYAAAERALNAANSAPQCLHQIQEPAPVLAEQHPDDAAVDALATLMKAKLAKQRAKGYGGWDTDCTRERLSELLRGHVDKGDPVDVANFCAFLSARGEGIAPQAAPAAVAVPDERAAFEQWLMTKLDAINWDPGLKDWYFTRREDGSYVQQAPRERWETWQARAALAATPAAAAQVEREDFAWLIVQEACETEPADEDDPECIRILRRDLKNAVLAAFLRGDAMPAKSDFPTLATAAAPVVLPEPVAWRHSQTYDLHETEDEVQLADGDEHAEPLYTEKQLHAALLAGVSAPAAQAVPVLYVSKGQLDHHRDPDGPDSLNAGRYLPARITPAGKFTTPLFAAPQAQADALEAQWLQPKDFEALQRFEETASDNQGHDIGKAAVARLVGFGCLHSHGFGVYSITDFGHFVLDDWEHARALPFRTQAERDADQRTAIAAQAAQQGGAA